MKKRTLLMATLNSHKFREAKAILNAAGLESCLDLKNMRDIGFNDDIPEEEDTLEGNASAKSAFAHSLSSLDCFSDDTGLEVECLNGAPGVHSARYAGDDANAGNNIRLLLGRMEGATNRRARFRTVISLINEGEEYFFEGVVNGEILTAPDGQEGFGYDPVFRPDGFDKSFAAMSEEEKNRISHRYQALRKMAEFLLISRLSKTN